MMSILFGLRNVSQHPISREEGEDTKTSKVFQCLEHVLEGEREINNNLNRVYHNLPVVSRNSRIRPKFLYNGEGKSAKIL